jgi:hypothetical protein
MTEPVREKDFDAEVETITAVAAVEGVIMVYKDDSLKQNLLERDAHHSELASRSSSCDTRPWLGLARSGRQVLLGELEPEKSLEILEQLFASGPVRVVAIDPEEDPEHGLIGTSTLIIELPSDPSHRARCFKIQAEQMTAGGYEPLPDVGQKFLMIHW